MSKLVNIAKYKADRGMQEQRIGMTTQAKEYDWKYWVDDFPVTQELMTLANSVKDVMPNLTFLPIDTEYKEVQKLTPENVQMQHGRIRVYNELCLCMEGNPFDLGRINYKDNTVVKGVKASTYGVYSRKIQNDKYGGHRTQHNMIMSSDINKAVKNISKYVVPYTAKELAQAFYDPMMRNVSKVLRDVEIVARDHVSDLRGDWQSILTEMTALKAQGVQFVTPKFRELSEKAEEVFGAYKAEAERKVNAVFVRFHKIGEETYVTLQEAHNIRNHDWDAKLNEATPTAIPVSDLPEDIVGSVSVLNILNNEQYVAGIGMKLDNNHFWIERG